MPRDPSTSDAASAPASKQKKRAANATDSSDDEDLENIDVDFEWFDPQEIDFHGLKTLLRQLFDADNELLELSGLVELILAQPLLGSTVKIPDDDVATHQTDPYAFLTVLNLHEHRTNPAITTLTRYLLARTQTQPLSPPLTTLLDASHPAQVGLLLTERLLNMPAAVVPPMYSMLLEEVDWALAAGEPYAFSHYLVLSKGYVEEASALSDGGGGEAEAPAAKKARKAGRKGGAAPQQQELFYFHPEDEVLQQHALWHCSFEYARQGGEGSGDAKRAFQEAGIRPVGRLVLIEAARFGEAVAGMKEAFGVGG